jgi:hypothetical protein
MSRIALISLADHSVVTAPISPGGWVTLPGIGQVSPAEAGWQGGGDPAQFALVAITDFTMPSGKQASGAATYAYDSGSDAVLETIPVEDIPAPPSVMDVVNAALSANGYSLDDLKAALGSS